MRFLVLAFAWALAAAIPVGSAAAATYPSGFEERTMVTGLTAPTGVAWAPDGRMFIIEKDGKLKVVAPGASTATTILDISSRVNSFHDRGLLGLAVDSSFATNGFVYLLYTYDVTPLTADSNGRMVSRLGRFTVSATNTVSAETVLLGSRVSGPCPTPSNTVDCIPSDGLSHSIGTVRSAPDGTLWVGSGDAASYSAVDPLAFRTYDERSMAGKIMHVDRNGRGLPGHPFCPTNTNLAHVCTKLWAKGFRNPFRFTLRPNGGLAVGDVGWSQREEVDLIGVGGKSYGWPCYEGGARTSGYRDRAECPPEYAKEGTASAHVGPNHDYPHVGDSAVLGGPTYTGDKYPGSYVGSIFFGDYAAGFVKRLILDAGGNVVSAADFASDLFAVDIEQTPAGELAYVSFGDGSPNGSVRRIVYTAANRSPTAAATATPSQGQAPLSVSFDARGSSDPDGDALSYEWDFGDGTPQGGGATATHTYTTEGSYTARLTVRDGRGGSDTESVPVVVGGSPPQASIDAPAPGSTYRDGQTVSLSGSATDEQDGTLPASAFAWTVRLFHDDHMHPVTSFNGTRAASFTTLDDHDANSYYEISLRVTDSSGQTDTETTRIDPETVPFALHSQPAGAPVTYAGTTAPAPMSRNAAIGFRTSISAAERFTSGGREWVFDRWSDGGARQHDVTIPATSSALTAHYVDAGASSLVAAYGFDEGSGSLTGDASGRGNRGTVSGAQWAPAGRFGKALDFDGVNDRVVVGDSDSLDLTTGMTLEAWVRTDNPGKTWQNVLMKEDLAHGGLDYALYATGSAHWPNAWWFNDGVWAPEAKPLRASTWTHLAVTADGTSFRMYIDGVLADTRPVTGPAPVGTGPLHIGGDSVWPNEFFDGLIDEVRIYNRALTATQIAADRDNPVGATPPGDTTAPSVAITQPSAGADVSGAVNVAANATDDTGVASVQFRLDGQALGAADSSAPYGVSWDTTANSNGAHVLTAVARDAAGNSASSNAVQVNVDNVPTPSGLVAAYGFEESSGTAVSDVSGSGNGGVLSGGASRTSVGRHGNGLLLDGVDDVMTVADSASLDLTGQITLEAWIKPDTPSLTWQTVLMKEAPGDLSYGLYATASSPHPNGWWGASGLYAPAAQALRSGTWTHVALTVSATTMKLYLDGTEVASRAVTSGPAASSGPLRVGGNSVWSAEHFDGVIDDVRVYDRALSAAEVTSDASAGVPAG